VSRGRDADVHHGLVVVDKPAGPTSHDVVAQLRRVFGQRSVGHAGTLDPDATGVLLVGIGRATRLLRFLQETTKAYAGTVVFGTTTTTLDAAGEITASFPMTELTLAAVREAALGFVGDIEQIPPMVSAIKIDGRPLHELAREGKEVDRAPRPVTIHRLDVVAFRAGGPGVEPAPEADIEPAPEADIEVECTSGTYIRTLAADLGTALGGGAHLRGLRRTRVGSFTLAEAHSLEEIQARSLECMVSPLVAMRALEPVVIDDEVAAKVAHGNTFAASAVLAPEAGPGPFAFAHDGRLLAVYERRGAGLKPAVVLA
jgi:tRNA pseudouridine55 synthase